MRFGDQRAVSRWRPALKQSEWSMGSPPGVGGGTGVPARSLAALFAGAAGVMGLLIVVPHGTRFMDGVAAAGAAFAFGVAVIVGGLGRRIPDQALHPLLILGLLVGSVVLVTGRGSPVIVAASSFYVAATMYAFRFFTRSVAVSYLVGAGVAAGVVLGLNADGAAPAEWLLVMATSTAVASAIWRVRVQLWRAALTDTLTGLANRQGLDFLLEREIGRIRRRGGRLSVAMVDLDGFKALNDALGHAAGDAMLARIARQWNEAPQDRDLLARYGGDEFVILLPDTEGDAAIQLLTRLQHSEIQPFSAGVATLTTSDTATTLMDRADSAMYAAKRRPAPHPPSRPSHPTGHPDKARR